MINLAHLRPYLWGYPTDYLRTPRPLSGRGHFCSRSWFIRFL